MTSLNQMKDEELIDLVKLNNQKALEVLYEKYFYKLCDFANKYLKDVMACEDVVSDVFLSFWLNSRKIKIQTTLRSYLYASVKNRSLTYIRNNTKNIENIEYIKQNISLSHTTVDNKLLYRELENEIDKVISQLPPKRQLIFRMNRLDGLKYKEIAEILSISVRTVQNHMVEAVRFIANHYSKLNSYKFIFMLLLAFLPLV